MPFLLAEIFVLSYARPAPKVILHGVKMDGPGDDSALGCYLQFDKGPCTRYKGCRRGTQHVYFVDWKSSHYPHGTSIHGVPRETPTDAPGENMRSGWNGSDNFRLVAG